MAVGAVLSALVFLGSMGFAFVPSLSTNGWVLWALATPVQFWVGRPVLPGRLGGGAPRQHHDGHPRRHGLSTAYFYSAAGVLFPGFFDHHGLGVPMYFDSASLIITLILFGRLLEARAQRTRPAPPSAR